MCFGFGRKKAPLETQLDPRYGAATITAPTDGAFADPLNPAPATALAAVVTTPPGTMPPMSQYNSPMPSARPPAEQLFPTSPPLSPPQQPAEAHLAKKGRPLSTGTMFSSYSSNASPIPSPEPSPKLVKLVPKRTPGADVTSALPLRSEASSQSPGPVPVHQAYLPADQLSIGSKLSPKFDFGGSSSIATTPTTASMHSGAGSKSNSNTISWAGSQNGILNEASSPISGKGSPSFFSKASPGFFKRETPTVPEHPESSTYEPAPYDRYERPSAATSPALTMESKKSPPLPLAQQTMQTQGAGVPVGVGTGGQAATQRLAKMRLPSIRLAAAPPKRSFKKWERSPETPGRVEQWPGSM